MPIISISSQLIEKTRNKIVQLFLVHNAIGHFKGRKAEVRVRNSKPSRILISTIFSATNVLVFSTRMFQIPILDTPHHPTSTKEDWKKWRMHSTSTFYHSGKTFSGTISSQIIFLHTKSFQFWHVIFDDSAGGYWYI